MIVFDIGLWVGQINHVNDYLITGSIHPPLITLDSGRGAIMRGLIIAGKRLGL